MNSFELYNPTKIIFGKDAYTKIAHEIPSNARILMLYGGGSIRTNGVYDAVKDQLQHHALFEFEGVEPNPSVQTLQRAIHIVKKEKIDYLLAVGGGSVIDGTKFIAAAALYDGEPWDILEKRIRIEKALPIATVLTLPATGSENNSGAVITNLETHEKLGMGGVALFPKVSFLNPEVVASIPVRQLRNGVVDAFTHVLEQYMTYPIGAELQDRFAESILKTLIDIAPKLLYEPYDYTTAANYMWCCSMALNGLIQKGVPTDWSTHMIGHELTALYGIDHAMTLAIIFPNLWRYQFEDKKEKLAQYGDRVWGTKDGDVENRANCSIKYTVDFLHSLGVKTKLSDYTEDYTQAPHKIKTIFDTRNSPYIGERKNISSQDIFNILRECL